MSLPSAVLWADPGKMTGLVLYVTSLIYPVPDHVDGTQWETPYCRIDEFDFMETGNQLERICSWWQGRLSVGWERFDIRPKTPPADAHHAIEAIGLARWNAQRYGCQILTSAAQEQRNIATRTMLEALGWWRPGKDDAQSAAQHMLAWMMRTNNVPGREASILAALRA